MVVSVKEKTAFGAVFSARFHNCTGDEALAAFLEMTGRRGLIVSTFDGFLVEIA